MRDQVGLSVSRKMRKESVYDGTIIKSTLQGQYFLAIKEGRKEIYDFVSKIVYI